MYFGCIDPKGNILALEEVDSREPEIVLNADSTISAFLKAQTKEAAIDTLREILNEAAASGLWSFNKSE